MGIPNPIWFILVWIGSLVLIDDPAIVSAQIQPNLTGHHFGLQIDNDPKYTVKAAQGRGTGIFLTDQVSHLL